MWSESTPTRRRIRTAPPPAVAPIFRTSTLLPPWRLMSCTVALSVVQTKTTTFGTNERTGCRRKSRLTTTRPSSIWQHGRWPRTGTTRIMSACKTAHMLPTDRPEHRGRARTRMTRVVLVRRSTFLRTDRLRSASLWPSEPSRLLGCGRGIFWKRSGLEEHGRQSPALTHHLFKRRESCF